jgi:hypothetical protein
VTHINNTKFHFIEYTANEDILSLRHISPNSSPGEYSPAANRVLIASHEELAADSQLSVYIYFKLSDNVLFAPVNQSKPESPSAVSPM